MANEIVIYPRIFNYANGVFSIAFDYNAAKTYSWQYSADGGTTWITIAPVVVNSPGGSANSYSQNVPPSFFTVGIRWIQTN